MSQLSVTVLPDGPFKVERCASLRFCGQELEVDGDVYLCRCGDSSNPPFCDGTHRTAGFDGSAAEGGAQDLRVWEGRTLDTLFNKTTCMHVFHCKPLDDLRERELAGDDAAAEAIMRVIDTCPSGALRYVRKDADAPLDMPDGAVAIDIQEGGEVRIQVPYEIDAPRHRAQPANRATLCRCGRSRNKPWCDGRHKGRKGFR